MTRKGNPAIGAALVPRSSGSQTVDKPHTGVFIYSSHCPKCASRGGGVAQAVAPARRQEPRVIIRRQLFDSSPSRPDKPLVFPPRSYSPTRVSFMSSLIDFLRRDGHTVDLGGDGAAIEDPQWVIQAAVQSQRSTYLTLTLITALGYEQVLAIAQEASQILHIESL